MSERHKQRSWRWLLCFVSLGFWTIASCQPLSSPQKGPPVQIQPAAGTLSPGSLITLSTSSPADIYYTLDQTRPDVSNGWRYEAPFALWSSSTIRVVAFDPQGNRGPEAKADFVLDVLLPRAIVSPRGGNYTAPVSVSFQTDPDAAVYYSLTPIDVSLRGDTLLKQLKRYTTPLTVTTDTTLSFLARDEAGNQERLQQVRYNFPPVLTIKPDGGWFRQEKVEVSISSNEKAGIQTRQLDGTPGALYKPYKEGTPLLLTTDTRLVVYARDDSGSEVTKTQDVALVPAFKATNTPWPKGFEGPVLAAATVDVEGLGRPSVYFATRSHLWRLEPGQGGQLTELNALTFVTRWIRVWDLDGDGLSDILIGDDKNKLHLFRAVTAGRFVADQGLLGPWSSAQSELQRVVPLDYDHDGQLDLLLLDTRAEQTRLLRRTSTGYIPQARLLPLVEAGAIDALAGDFDKDQRADLLILPGGQKAPYVLYGDGKGAFRRISLSPLLVNLHEQVSWRHAARADFDNDGDLDLVLIGRGVIPTHQDPHAPTPGQQGLHVILLERLVAQQWRRNYSMFLKDQVIRSLSVADGDADGIPDLFLQVDGKPSLWLKNLLGRRLFVVPPATQESWPSAWAGGAGDITTTGQVEWSLLTSNGHQRWAAPLKHSLFVKPVLQGIRGNRNAIGATIRWDDGAFRIRMQEVGVHTTGPDQAPLSLASFFAMPSHVGKLIVRWSDGQTREVPAPQTNKLLLLEPY